MDYSQYKSLEFRRKYFKLFGAAISIFPANSNDIVGYIKMKAWSLRGDVRVFKDTSMQQEIVRIGGRQIVSFNKAYEVFDSITGNILIVIHQRSLKSDFFRDHMDITDANGNQYGYVQETSKGLALVRRWIIFVPYIGFFGDILFLFVPQTFNIMYAPNGAEPQLAGTIVHKKNPALVKMTLDTSTAEAPLDPRLNIAIVSLLCVLDAAKNK
jgi:hypothetical protein